MTGEIIAFAEQREGALKKSAREVVTAAAKVGRELGAGVVAVAFAEGAVEGAGALGCYGATEVLLAGGGGPAACARVLATLARERQARAVLLPASAEGKDIAPRVAALLDAPQASDCVRLRAAAGAIEAVRPVYGGKALWTVRSRAPCFLATLRPNVFTADESLGAALEPVRLAPAGAPAAAATLKEVLAPQGGRRLEVTEADVIVAGGRGMKAPEHFALLEGLAEALGGTVGASRAVVDAGWRPHAEQIGQTGKTVAPTLYVACGISGAIQHLAGMSSSRVIVAINKDPEAPIFKVADYGVVGDVLEVVPALTEEVKKAKAAG
ncbi:MAG: electron transfer flavoprotein subunit alpha/FixB family protein [Planctomycetes bacterium]|nr:electron transfer flavoprotein subunit alpha/FixB family protein [Planctomycetota bacterium]